jgi:hypothetical protein
MGCDYCLRQTALPPFKPDILHVCQHAGLVFRVKQPVYNRGADTLIKGDYFFHLIKFSTRQVRMQGKIGKKGDAKKVPGTKLKILPKRCLAPFMAPFRSA